MAVNVLNELGGVLLAGVLEVDGVRVVARDTALDVPLADAARRLQHVAERSEITAAVRRLYRAVGLDPTKTRPSSEALLRRIRKGQEFPRINGVVDIGNWCSVETQLPFGVYDVGHIEGPVHVRLGREGEQYAGIRKDFVHVASRIVLADDLGAFGNPTADSARTMVTDTTRCVLVVVYGPVAEGRPPVDDALSLTAARLEQFTGGRVAGRQVI